MIVEYNTGVSKFTARYAIKAVLEENMMMGTHGIVQITAYIGNTDLFLKFATEEDMLAFDLAIGRQELVALCNAHIEKYGIRCSDTVDPRDGHYDDA